MKIYIQILVFLFAFHTTFYAFSANTCQEEDYTALRALYLSTDGDNWSDNTGWLTAAEFLANPTLPTGIDVGTWYGVITNPDSCVIELNLVLNRLTGSIPPELGKLSNVTRLRLNSNDLIGSIPPELGNLSNLNYFSLKDNELGGSIPPELGNLSNLEVLWLGGNWLSGSIPPELGNLSNLIQLYLHRNYFLTGSIPPELGNLSNLEALFLNGNELSGSIPPELGNLSKLEWLLLEGNQLTGNIPPELGNLSSLDGEFSLSYNQLTGSIPPELGNFSSLEGKFSLSNNQLTGSIPPELGNLSNVKFFYLQNNQLTGSIPSELGNLNNVLDFYIYNNQLSGCYSSALSKFCNFNSNSDVSNGNNFDAPWNDFCNRQAGTGIPINLKVLLEGAYDSTRSEMITNLNTERGLLPGQTPTSSLVAPTPAGQPYNAAPWNYTGTEGTDWTDDSYSSDAVDWVLISLRTDITKESERARAAGVINKDGTVTLPDRCALSVDNDSVYVVIEHRNHIGIMTPHPVAISDSLTYDFTQGNSYDGNATGAGQKELSFGLWGMYVGDADQSADANSYDINGSDKTPWVEDNGSFYNYAPTDFNMDGDVSGADKTIWFENYGISSRVPK